MNLIKGFKEMGDMLVAAPDLLASTIELGEQAKAQAAAAQAAADAQQSGEGVSMGLLASYLRLRSISDGLADKSDAKATFGGMQERLNQANAAMAAQTAATATPDAK